LLTGGHKLLKVLGPEPHMFADPGAPHLALAHRL
jgi:hypothetical protein